MTTEIKISMTALISGILNALNFTFHMFKYLLIIIENCNTEQKKNLCVRRREETIQKQLFSGEHIQLFEFK